MEICFKLIAEMIIGWHQTDETGCVSILTAFCSLFYWQKGAYFVLVKKKIPEWSSPRFWTAAKHKTKMVPNFSSRIAKVSEIGNTQWESVVLGMCVAQSTTEQCRNISLHKVMLSAMMHCHPSLLNTKDPAFPF